MNEKVILVAGGPKDLWPSFSAEDLQPTLWIGIDRGAWRLLERGILMELAVGDFDSLSESERHRLGTQVKEIRQVSPTKDETDTELALEIAMTAYPDAQSYLLIGATGGRLDHFFSNILLVFQPRFQSIIERLTLRDQNNLIRFLLPGKHLIQKEAAQTYLSFICLTPVKQLSLAGVKYPLTQKNVLFPTAFTSNEFCGTIAKCSFTEGVIAVIQSHDA